uniref:cysteine/serine-rich nuclear protein 1-like n=1 Tax=Doryrhamphus excisus TaxID=161450 RepID=UPI0025AECA11|nr:cysteine/serine-rich nuclear protein 1-like [Doryrhamphus excisus]XP_057923518.1 cysteine/serine-rich nuclear protein 1-like [Doryrhamphus excisus]XP_057923519.1 cysteine/serine-rich nuclear protein 1-like [Doryrhamphus excisus]
MAGLLKRKFAEIEDNCSSSSLSSSSPTSSEWESDGEGGSSDAQDFTPHSPPAPTSLPTASIVKKPRLVKRQCHVRFDQVMVFSFPRCQGFTSVPSHGGATLGMTRRHSALCRYTVAEHELERRCRQRGFDALKQELISSEEGQLLNGDVHISDAELEDGGSLQPYSSRQRQALLLAAGVKRIDREEKKQLHALRLSREACGCDCQGFCEPETCACSLAGIKCQVDRFTFPCGCTKDSCGNTEGHVEFDSKRVHTHYIHTVMRLELERRLQDEAISREDRSGISEDHVGSEEPVEARAVTNRCPFGFTLEEDDLALTIPTSPSFILRSVMEENSCSSDMTESSFSSSDCDGGRLQTGHEVAPCTLSICDSENNNYSMCDQLRLMAAPLTPERSSSTNTTPDNAGPLPTNTFTDNQNKTATDYLDENANQARDPFEDENSLEVFPNTPFPTLEYPSSRYMDPSLSSDSDLEFFDSDYPPGPLHSSFKEHRHSDSFHHLQLISSVYLPPCESSAYLLESLIGLTESSPEQPCDNQLF